MITGDFDLLSGGGFWAGVILGSLCEPGLELVGARNQRHYASVPWLGFQCTLHSCYGTH